MYSTVNDLYLWDRALYTEKLASREMLSLLLTPHYRAQAENEPQFGYGWRIGTEFGRQWVTHGGAFSGAGGRIGRFVEDDPFRPHTVIIVLSNADWAPIDWIGKDLAAIVFGEFYEPPAKRSGTIIALDPQIFNQYAGEYEHSKLFKLRYATIAKVALIGMCITPPAIIGIIWRMETNLSYFPYVLQTHRASLWLPAGLTTLLLTANLPGSEFELDSLARSARLCRL